MVNIGTLLAFIIVCIAVVILRRTNPEQPRPFRTPGIFLGGLVPIVPFLGIALIPGLLALLLYYRALASTPATLATVAEMAYPVAATIIATAPAVAVFGQTIFFGQRLYPAQAIGTLLLIAVIALLNWSKERTPPVIVQQEAAA